MREASTRQGTARLSYVPAPDVTDVLLPKGGGGRKLERGIADVLGPGDAIELVASRPGGWGRTLGALGDGGRELRGGVLFTSVSAEVADRTAEPRRRLAELAKLVREREGRLVVLNASSVVPRDTDRDADGEEPLDLVIRRLNLAVVEASHESGLSVLDADRIVTEATLRDKVAGAFDYAPEICERLLTTFVTILGDLGLAAQPVMEVRVPFVRQATDLRVERWLKEEGDVVEADDAICEIRMGHARRLTRPTSAVVLASIDGRTPLSLRLMSRERVRRRARSAVLSVVARDTAVLRKIVRARGAAVRAGDRLGLLTRDAAAPLDPSEVRPDVFRAVMRTDDPVIEGML